MNDIIPPRRPTTPSPRPSQQLPSRTVPPRAPQPSVPQPAQSLSPQPVTQKLSQQPLRPQMEQPTTASRPIAPRPPQNTPTPPNAPVLPHTEKPVRRSRKGWWIAGSVLVVLLALISTAFIWYKISLQPVASGDKTRTRVQILSGSTPSDIAQTLESKKLIRSQFAFDIYTRLSGSRSSLQAGSYSLSPSESMEEIVSHLTSGNVDQFNITFLPGATLAEDRAALIKAGYSDTDVDKALGKTYTHPLFADKPANTDLEGYIYGETYSFDSSATVEQILTKTFDQYYEAIQTNHLVEGFKAQGFTLYQGITLASIIQREVPNKDDQKQVAQIFLKRRSIGMPLGSDVTYQYAAKKLGVAPSPDLDSPYNTRKYAGLPPGPIATPGLSALEAVASPASGDYLFFLSGDDDVTYYARTDAEHEANIHDHCQVKCSTL